MPISNADASAASEPLSVRSQPVLSPCPSDAFEQGAFRDAALILVAHGSSVNEDSSRPVKALVGELERRAWFDTVRCAFVKERPYLPEALDGLSQPRIFIVPFLISGGYFCEEVIPRELGFRQADQKAFCRVRQSAGQTFHYCEPIGTTARMTDVIQSRATGVLASHPFPRQPALQDVTLVIAGHGTPLNAASREAVERQATLIRARGEYANVFAAFMEEDPRIAGCWKLAETRNVVVVPFFLSDGMHVREDIPILLGEHAQRVHDNLKAGRPTWKNPTERHGKRIWYSDAIGSDPVILEAVLDRVCEAASRSSDGAQEPKGRSD